MTLRDESVTTEMRVRMTRGDRDALTLLADRHDRTLTGELRHALRLYLQAALDDQELTHDERWSG